MCGKDGEAAAPGTKIKHVIDFFRCGDPRAELFEQQFGDERARHDDTFIHVKTEISQYRLMGQIGSRNAFFYALLNDAQYCSTFVISQLRIEKWIQSVQWQM